MIYPVSSDSVPLKLLSRFRGPLHFEIRNTGGATSFTGSIANDTLYGGNGNDTLSGGGGNDSLEGGTGNDTYVVDSSTDTITEAAKAGTDLVQSSVSLTLSNNLENLTLTGTVGLTGTGNALNNSITGTSGNDTLSGGAGTDTLIGGLGNDTLNGGLGNDLLTGGDGSDVFFFNTATTKNIDTIIDFVTGTDKLVLDDDIFKKFVGTLTGATLNAENLKVGAGTSTVAYKAQDANDYLVYDTTSDLLYYDADGSGKGAAVAVVKIELLGNAQPKASDFLIVS